MKGYLFAFTIVFLVGFCFGDCPNAADFAPCTCDGEGLNCRLALDHLEIKQAFKTYTTTPSARAIYVQGTPVKKLTKDIFGRYAIREFYLDLNQIRSVESGTFENSYNLTTTISLYKNKLQSFPYEDVSKFTNLQVLNLASNEITSIPDNALAKNAPLERIILMFNQISYIGKNAFSGLTKLKSLELGSNQISTLGPLSFSIPNHEPQLAILLSENSVRTVSPTAFTKTAPNIILLDKNNMTSFTETNFKTIINYMALVEGFISVPDNNFSCIGCDYRWLVGNRNANNVLAGFTCNNGLTLPRLSLSNIKC